MSLLIDALRQAEAAQRPPADPVQTPESSLQLEPVAALPPETPAQTASSGMRPARNAPATTTATGTPREAIKDLFELKQPSPSHVPLILAAGGLLALLIGALYLWWATQQRGGIQPGTGLERLPPSAPQIIVPPPPASPVIPSRALPATAPAPAAAPAPSVKPLLPPAPDTPLTSPGMVIRRTPPSVTGRSLAQDAHEAYLQGRFAEAYQGYAAVLEQDPNNTEALNALALLTLRNGQRNDAERYWRQSVSKDPKNALARSQLALLAAEADPAGAESRLRSLLAEQPEATPALFALGSLQARQGRWAEAQQNFFQAHTLDPRDADTLYNLAVALDHLQQGRLASQYYEHAAAAASAGHHAFDPALARRRALELNAAGTPPAP